MLLDLLPVKKFFNSVRNFVDGASENFRSFCRGLGKPLEERSPGLRNRHEFLRGRFASHSDGCLCMR